MQFRISIVHIWISDGAQLSMLYIFIKLDNVYKTVHLPSSDPSGQSDLPSRNWDNSIQMCGAVLQGNCRLRSQDELFDVPAKEKKKIRNKQTYILQFDSFEMNHISMWQSQGWRTYEHNNIYTFLKLVHFTQTSDFTFLSTRLCKLLYREKNASKERIYNKINLQFTNLLLTIYCIMYGKKYASIRK